MSTTTELISDNPHPAQTTESTSPSPPMPWYALEEGIERTIRFPHTLPHREREELDSLVASTKYARDLATYFGHFYTELNTLASEEFEYGNEHGR